VAPLRSAFELGTDFCRLCFAYPEQTAGRKHGPHGYANYESYRDWLRDEFCFRCACCLMREPWLRGPRGFQIDHCLPQAQYPAGRLDYDNLVYTCPWCNQAKAGVAVPNPTEVVYGTALRVKEDGVIEAKSQLGQVLLEGLKLDHPELTYQRRLLLGVVRLAEERNHVALLVGLLGYPDDLPNLRSKRPPGGNARHGGVVEICRERRRRGELPPVYGWLSAPAHDRLTHAEKKHLFFLKTIRKEVHPLYRFWGRIKTHVRVPNGTLGPKIWCAVTPKLTPAGPPWGN
jgi:hypothetical protein